jgi:peptide/nickel transport system permease protein
MASITSNNKTAVATLSPQKVERGDSNLARSLRRLRKHRMAMFGLFLLTAIVLYVVIGSFIFTEKQSNFNNPAIGLRPPSAEYPFGTDAIGRNILIRTIYGGQISLFIAVTAVVLQILLGTIVGLVAGYAGGWLDALLMRIVEMLVSIPALFLALISVRILSTGLRDFRIGDREFSSTMIVMILVIGITSWMRVARIVRAQVLSVKEQEFITAARAIGVKNRRIIFSHVLPNCIAPIIVSATLGVGAAILTEAYLGFLGLGVRVPTATWGNMMGEAFGYLPQWYYWFFPAMFIVLTSLGINFFGDGLRDALDPRSTK